MAIKDATVVNKSDFGYRGFYMLLLGGFLYSLYGVFSRTIGNAIPQFFQVWSRGAVIILLLLIFGFFTKTKLLFIRKKDWPWVLLLAVSSGLLSPLFYIAINNLAIGTTLFSYYATSTVISYTLGKLLLKEKLTRVKIISLFVALIGLLFLYVDIIHFGNWRYLIFSAVSGALFGVNINAIKKINYVYPSLQVNIFNWSGATLINLFISVFLGEHWSWTVNTIPWSANIGLALCSFAASLSVIYGFKFIEVQKGSMVLLSELIFGILLGFFIYREIPSSTAIAGSFLVIIALLVPNLRQFQNKKLNFLKIGN